MVAPATEAPAADAADLPCPPASDAACSSPPPQQQQEGAHLIRISRACYDAAARALLLVALEEVVGFLGACEPFKAGPARMLRCQSMKRVALGEVVEFMGVYGSSIGCPHCLQGLARELLTALVVLCKPITAGAGEVLAAAGSPIEALAIVQVRWAPRPCAYISSSTCPCKQVWQQPTIGLSSLVPGLHLSSLPG